MSTDIKFAKRFERYLDYNFFEHQIHWFSIFNSFMMVIFLTVRAKRPSGHGLARGYGWDRHSMYLLARNCASHSRLPSLAGPRLNDPDEDAAE